MAWTLLKAREEWAAYTAKTARELGVAADRVNWGAGPEAYPCLVGTLFPPRAAGSDPKVYSAFVYEADAEELFAAAGRKFVDRGELLPPSQAQFNRWKAAESMAVAWFLTETKICTQAQYEEKLLEALELVDEHIAGKLDKGKLTGTQLTVLDTLRPPG
jgi:hypothetical protein